MRRAIYAGSFDPVTLGHVDVMARGAALFDELIVAVGTNPAKRTLLTAAERTGLIEAVAPAPNLRVVTFSGLLVDTAREYDAGVLLRGVRSPSDFDLEFRNGLANRDLAGIETLFLLSDPATIFVSSSLVKEIASNGGDVSRYVPAPVLDLLAKRLR